MDKMLGWKKMVWAEEWFVCIPYIRPVTNLIDVKKWVSQVAARWLPLQNYGAFLCFREIYPQAAAAKPDQFHGRLLLQN